MFKDLVAFVKKVIIFFSLLNILKAIFILIMSIFYEELSDSQIMLSKEFMTLFNFYAFKAPIIVLVIIMIIYKRKKMIREILPFLMSIPLFLIIDYNSLFYYFNLRINYVITILLFLSIIFIVSKLKHNNKEEVNEIDSIGNEGDK